MVTKKCVTFKTSLSNERGSVTFKCPKCLKFEISRSPKAREISAKYVCPNCGFEGPN
ncbi:MAG: zinc finger domain-containing protein [Candidatus Woesearchaeota archaeon]